MAPSGQEETKRGGSRRLVVVVVVVVGLERRGEGKRRSGHGSLWHWTRRCIFLVLVLEGGELEDEEEEEEEKKWKEVEGER